VVLCEVAEGSEIMFHRLVPPLGLAVSLRVEDSRQSVVNTHVGAVSSP
jgi:hypothetical protein